MAAAVGPDGRFTVLGSGRLSLGLVVLGAILLASCQIAAPPPAGIPIAAPSGATATPDPLRLEQEIASLRERIDYYSGFLTVLVAVLTATLALGSVGSLYSMVRGESRQQAEHKLAVRGETRAQERTEEIHSGFLKSSMETVSLVNATLELARDASEKAATAVRESAASMLEDLDSRSKQLVPFAYDDERALVTNPAHRAMLQTLALELNLFDGISRVFARDLKPSAEALFVRATDFHIRQNFEKGIEMWRAAQGHEKWLIRESSG